jgi:sugar lactone lactonase YvrE
MEGQSHAVARSRAYQLERTYAVDISRRSLLTALSAASVAGLSRHASAAEQPLKLAVAVRSPWMANQVALTSKNILFLGCPRYTAKEATPCLARRNADGRMAPFPGNSWNEWKPGDDGRDAFVYLNSVHVFADDTVWCVDQGSLSADAFSDELSVPKPGAQKIVQLDADTGAILRVIRFADDILPAGAKMNDLRFHGSKMYVTDSGLGAIIVHDLETGKTLRRLSGRKPLMAADVKISLAIQPGSQEKPFHPPNSDMIEISNDGEWLFWAAPTGPLYKIETRLLNDASLSDDALEKQVVHVADIAFSSGCAMDSLGNVYFCETKTGKITLMSAAGKTATLVSDPNFIRPDGAFISADRQFYVPLKPKEPGAPADTPFAIYSMPLPDSFDGIRLGRAVTGAA